MEANVAASVPSSDKPNWLSWLRTGSCRNLCLLAAMLLLANVPGQVQTLPDMGLGGKYGPDFPCNDPCLEHGWPWVYLRRDAIVSDFDLPLPVWQLWIGNKSFFPAAFVADLALAVAILAVGQRHFARTRIVGGPWWQWSVRGSLVLLSVIAAACAWTGVQLREFRREQRAVAQLSSPNSVSYQPGGPSWLRRYSRFQLVNFQESSLPWRWLDRVVSVDMEGREVAAAPGWPSDCSSRINCRRT